MKVEFSLSRKHTELWRSKKRYTFIMGGRGNGRSYTASVFNVTGLTGKQYFRGAIMRAIHGDIRTSIWQEINDRIESIDDENHTVSKVFKKKEGDMYIKCGQNSLRAHGFRAASGGLTARLKSLANYNTVTIEEAEEIGEEEFMKLDDSLRTIKGDLRIILVLNTPPKNHWILKRWFNLIPSEIDGFYIPVLKPEMEDTCLYIGGTWEDNKQNIDPATAVRYEGYKHTKPFYYYHVIRGLSPETKGGKYYKGWRKVTEIPHEAKLLGYGTDFGFDPDPCAVVSIWWHNGGYIIKEEIYDRDLSPSELAARIKLLPRGPVICDSASPGYIKELRMFGIDAHPCEKGEGSVLYGIKHVQSLRISFLPQERFDDQGIKMDNLESEYEGYAQKFNKTSGEYMNYPDPTCADHLMDAIRYALMQFAGENSVYNMEKIEDEKRKKALRMQTQGSNSTQKYGL
jgi:phage terminase large subunit